MDQKTRRILQMSFADFKEQTNVIKMMKEDGQLNYVQGNYKDKKNINLNARRIYEKYRKNVSFRKSFNKKIICYPENLNEETYVNLLACNKSSNKSVKTLFKNDKYKSGANSSIHSNECIVNNPYNNNTKECFNSSTTVGHITKATYPKSQRCTQTKDLTSSFVKGRDTPQSSYQPKDYSKYHSKTKQYQQQITLGRYMPPISNYIEPRHYGNSTSKKPRNPQTKAKEKISVREHFANRNKVPGFSLSDWWKESETDINNCLCNKFDFQPKWLTFEQILKFSNIRSIVSELFSEQFTVRKITSAVVNKYCEKLYKNVVKENQFPSDLNFSANFLMTELPKIINAHNKKSSKMNKTVGSNEIDLDFELTTEANQSTQLFQASQTALVIQATKGAQIREVAQMVDAIKAFEGTQAIQVTQVSQSVQVIPVTPAIRSDQGFQVTQATQVTKSILATQMTQATHVLQATHVPQVNQATQASPADIAAHATQVTQTKQFYNETKYSSGNSNGLSDRYSVNEDETIEEFENSITQIAFITQSTDNSSFNYETENNSNLPLFVQKKLHEFSKNILYSGTNAISMQLKTYLESEKDNHDGGNSKTDSQNKDEGSVQIEEFAGEKIVRKDKDEGSVQIEEYSEQEIVRNDKDEVFDQKVLLEDKSNGIPIKKLKIAPENECVAPIKNNETVLVNTFLKEIEVCDDVIENPKQESQLQMIDITLPAKSSSSSASSSSVAGSANCPPLVHSGSSNSVWIVNVEEMQAHGDGINNLPTSTSASSVCTVSLQAYDDTKENLEPNEIFDTIDVTVQARSSSSTNSIYIVNLEKIKSHEDYSKDLESNAVYVSVQPKSYSSSNSVCIVNLEKSPSQNHNMENLEPSKPRALFQDDSINNFEPNELKTFYVSVHPKDSSNTNSVCIVNMDTKPINNDIRKKVKPVELDTFAHDDTLKNVESNMFLKDIDMSLQPKNCSSVNLGSIVNFEGIHTNKMETNNMFLKDIDMSLQPKNCSSVNLGSIVNFEGIHTNKMETKNMFLKDIDMSLQPKNSSSVNLGSIVNFEGIHTNKMETIKFEPKTLFNAIASSMQPVNTLKTISGSIVKYNEVKFHNNLMDIFKPNEILKFNHFSKGMYSEFLKNSTMNNLVRIDSNQHDKKRTKTEEFDHNYANLRIQKSIIKEHFETLKRKLCPENPIPSLFRKTIRSNAIVDSSLNPNPINTSVKEVGASSDINRAVNNSGNSNQNKKPRIDVELPRTQYSSSIIKMANLIDFKFTTDVFLEKQRERELRKLSKRNYFDSHFCMMLKNEILSRNFKIRPKLPKKVPKKDSKIPCFKNTIIEKIIYMPKPIGPYRIITKLMLNHFQLKSKFRSINYNSKIPLLQSPIYSATTIRATINISSSTKYNNIQILDNPNQIRLSFTKKNNKLMDILTIIQSLEDYKPNTNYGLVKTSEDDPSSCEYGTVFEIYNALPLFSELMVYYKDKDFDTSFNKVFYQPKLKLSDSISYPLLSGMMK